MGTYSDSDDGTMSMNSEVDDVVDLLGSMLSSGKDEYGRELVPPIPLFFDRINEGRPPRSNSLLFQLPFEILEEITLCLSEPSLAALSLVSKDCCQLARSSRFGSVQFNYSVPQSHLIKKLLEEARERGANNGFTLSPSIGACFRRLQIATDGHWASKRLNIDLDSLNDIEKAEQKKRVRKAYSLFFGDYLPNIELILARALPHLELLDMQDIIPLPRSFFNVLACSSIQHLKLSNVRISEEFEIALPNALAHRGWPLRTLHLEVSWRITDNQGSTAPLCTSILQMCAPTLEKLTWATRHLFDEDDIQSLVKEEPIHFRQLRELALKSIQFSDYSTLKLLIFPQPESQLELLETDADNGSLVAQFLESCGTITSLKTFVWRAYRLAPDQPLSFLRHNPQLSKLRIYSAQPPALLEKGILPILSQSFQALRSLSLTWEGTSISTSALEIIGTLRGLEQLHLSTGCQGGWRFDWLIEHQEMQESLGTLGNLKKLAFSRDSYKYHGRFEEDYYSCKYQLFTATPEDLEGLDGFSQLERSDQIWERQHRRRILLEAEHWVRVLPRLEWMYFGQVPMGVVRAGEDQKRQAVVLSHERDDCRTLLARMFGRESDGD